MLTYMSGQPYNIFYEWCSYAAFAAQVTFFFEALNRTLTLYSETVYCLWYHWQRLKKILWLHLVCLESPEPPHSGVPGKSLSALASLKRMVYLCFLTRHKNMELHRVHLNQSSWQYTTGNKKCLPFPEVKSVDPQTELVQSKPPRPGQCRKFSIGTTVRIAGHTKWKKWL